MMSLDGQEETAGGARTSSLCAKLSLAHLGVQVFCKYFAERATEAHAVHTAPMAARVLTRRIAVQARAFSAAHTPQNGSLVASAVTVHMQPERSTHPQLKVGTSCSASYICNTTLNSPRET
jgi:hypothetical protein